MTNHLSEADVQQYALDEENCPAWIVAHLRLCEDCLARANNYRLIFKEVSRMPAPAMETDIAERILTKLDQGHAGILGTSEMPGRLIGTAGETDGSSGKVRRTIRLARRKKDRSLAYWLAGGGLLVLTVCWFFKNSFLSMGRDIPVMILYVLVGVSLVIAVARALGMIIQYRRQLKNLNLSQR